MFNKKKKGNQADHAAVATKDPVALVKEIHGKILTAGEHCVAYANEILQGSSDAILEEKKRIAGLNFDNAPEVIEARKFVKEHGEALERARVAKYFQDMYPNCKYIFREDMEKICKEYGLILGPDKFYQGENGMGIPERSLKQIIAFKLREQDELFWKGTWRGIEDAKVSGTSRTQKGVYDWTEITREEYNKGSDNGANLVKDNKRTHYQSNRNYFTIAAPQRMFNMEGKVVEGTEMKEVVERVEIINLDPACLKAVKYGFLVIAVWGEEMAIKALQNEKMN